VTVIPYSLFDPSVDGEEFERRLAAWRRSEEAHMRFLAAALWIGGGGMLLAAIVAAALAV
jgi:hypothetical protein